MSIFKKIFKGNTLYYPGCLSKFVAKELVENYRRILREAGVDFIELSDLEVCCGSPALKAGYTDDFRKLAEKNLQIFKDHSVDKIVTHCPACFMIFKKEYPKVLGEKWDIEVAHATEILNQKTKKSESIKGAVTYHDPCHLGRQMGVYEPPREIIKSLGYEIKEMELAGKESFCCGGGGGVQANESELADKIAKDRIAMAKKIGANILVTPCPLCYMHLKKNSEGEDIDVKELSHLM
ncbi:MAG: (Fe-S)-binding protein [Patescibacteria group bacterium]